MKKVNLVIIFNKEKSKVLMCKRMSDPYIGKFNFIGGKLEKNENEIQGAYRELFEESGISKDDTNITHFMDYTYPIDNLIMNIFYGVLNKDIDLVEEKHPLHWIDLNTNFMDDKFAGDGNIYHMLNIATEYMKRECNINRVSSKY